MSERINSREECPMRHTNGNCLVIGGFCTSVNDEICNGLRNAYAYGETKAKHECWELSKCNECCVSQNGQTEYCVYCPYRNTMPVKHGHWEILNAHEEGCYDIAGVKTWATKARCSQCGVVHYFIENHMVYAYCPDCGEKMDEVTDNG